MFFRSSLRISRLLHIIFCNFLKSSFFPLKSHKTIDQRITMWFYNNSNEHYINNKPVTISIVPHFPNVAQFPQDIYLEPFVTPRYRDTDRLLFMIRGNGSIGYRSCKTSHSSSYHRNDNDKISEEEGFEMSSGEESCGHRSLETTHYSSINHRDCEHRFLRPYTLP